MEEYINQDTTDDFSEYCHAVAAAKPLVGVLISVINLVPPSGHRR